MFLFYSRFLSAVARSFFHQRIQVGETSVFPFMCSPFECEFLRYMNGSMMLHLAEVAEQYNNLNTTFFQTAVKKGIRPVTRRFWSRHYRPIRIFQRGEVHTRLAWWNDYSVIWHNRILVGGKLCTEVYAEVLIVAPGRKVTIAQCQEWMGVKVASPVLDEDARKLLSEWTPYVPAARS